MDLELFCRIHEPVGSAASVQRSALGLYELASAHLLVMMQRAGFTYGSQSGHTLGSYARNASAVSLRRHLWGCQ